VPQGPQELAAPAAAAEQSAGNMATLPIGVMAGAATLRSAPGVGGDGSGPVPRIGAVTADAVSHTVTPKATGRTSLIISLIAVLGLVVFGLVGIVVLVASDGPESSAAAAETDGPSPSGEPAAVGTAADGDSPARSPEPAVGTVTAASGAGGAPPDADQSATASTTASASQSAAKPERPPVRRPPQKPANPWSPFDDR
jgi:hypothetical protein